MAELHRHKFCAVSYSEKADVLAICNIAKNYLIDSFTKIVEDFIVSFDDVRQFENILCEVAQNPKVLLDMKEKCIQKAKEYVPEKAIQVLLEKLG